MTVSSNVSPDQLLFPINACFLPIEIRPELKYRESCHAERNVLSPLSPPLLLLPFFDSHQRSPLRLSAFFPLSLLVFYFFSQIMSQILSVFLLFSYFLFLPFAFRFKCFISSKWLIREKWSPHFSEWLWNCFSLLLPSSDFQSLKGWNRGDWKNKKKKKIGTWNLFEGYSWREGGGVVLEKGMLGERGWSRLMGNTMDDGWGPWVDGEDGLNSLLSLLGRGPIMIG